MRFIGYKELKEIEANNKKASKKALLKAAILASTIVSVLVVLAPSMKDNILFYSLGFGFLSFFTVYSTSMYEIKLLEKLGVSEDQAEEEVDNA